MLILFFTLSSSSTNAGIFPKKDLLSEEKAMEVALEAGADDVAEEDGVWEIVCDPEEFHAVKVALEAEVELEHAEVQFIPKTRNKVDEETSKKVLKLLDKLEDLDDVLSVSSNVDSEE